MNISIDPIRQGYDFAGRVRGTDLRQTLRPDEVAAIEKGMDDFGVLVFPGQDITDDQQLVFAENFGPIEHTNGTVRSEGERLKNGIADISNLDENNRLLDKEDRRRIFNLGNFLWHSDSSFRETPARYSMLSARAIPSIGGNTEFADMRGAYDALAPGVKNEIEDLVCEHSLLFSRAQLGFKDFTDEERERFEPVLQRLVRKHPRTGRRNLYLSAHIGAIKGMPIADALLLLSELTEHATQREFVYQHHWTRFDLVMWDNRTTMHRGRKYDESQPRDLRRFTTMDDGPTVALR